MDTDNKKCQISLVKTDKAQNCVIIDERNHMFFTELLLTQSYLSSLNMKSYHIYITSDDINEGDWIYMKETSTIQVNHIQSNVINEVAKKIIATTDTSLLLPTISFKEWDGKSRNLPQPSKQFIQKYIEDWNKGDKIENGLWDNHECGYALSPNDAVNMAYNNIKTGKKLNRK